uniref:Superoxide dismutase n=1 Tax=Philasterides dicentrarchi TaxID=282688 RepID=A0A481XSU7_9CILI|nr:iron superoxide dismutase [Philasterides dicentrarchi]QKV26158.1 iron superoxide dismutase [Philasterides dicentrarchi]
MNKYIIFFFLAVIASVNSSSGDDECNHAIGGQFPYTALEYPYNALEPFIIQQTMELHHDKHYKAYTDNCNAAVINTPLVTLSMEDIIRDYSRQNTKIRNNCGGYYNHCLFWKFMQGNQNQLPEGKLMKHIQKSFGNYDSFVEQFETAASSVFGSGWAWLVLTENQGEDQNLRICSTPNQDSPLFNQNDQQCKGQIILLLDVWEHAYYLQYFNVRANYINNWWSVVNWRYAERRYEKAMEYSKTKKIDLL